MLVFCLHKGAEIKLINQINTNKPVYDFITLDLNIYLFIRISVGNASTSRLHGHLSQILGSIPAREMSYFLQGVRNVSRAFFFPV
jgi:hypothetical protein